MAKPQPSAAPNQSSTLMTWLNNENVRGILYQVLVGGLVVLLGWYLISNTLENLERQNISTGFGYMDLEASFGISESPIEYSPADSYADALLVGILNTVKVAVIGIILATIIGTVIGIMRLSSNYIAARFAAAFVEFFRNIPVLIQLVFWYSFITATLPGVRNAASPMEGVYITNRGFYLAWPAADPAHGYMLIAFLIGLIGTFFLRRWALQRQAATGEILPYWSIGLGGTFALVVLAWLAGGAPTAMDMPVLKGFNFAGGMRMSPEFAAVLFGLTIYTAAFIAEVVRGGIEAVNKGQWEAADSLGLDRGKVMRLIILPQSMRVIIPPLTNQYLNLTKNSSLAVAVGYPDLVSVSNTTMNQTGQAIEAISIYMGIYLTLSIVTSLFMNWFNKKMALVER